MVVLQIPARISSGNNYVFIRSCSFLVLTSSSFIERYCSRLNINQQITKVCEFVALRIQNNNLIPENTPHSVAAGIIYFIAMNCNLNINKRDVNKVSSISEVTINKCYKKLEAIKEQLIPTVIFQKYNK